MSDTIRRRGMSPAKRRNVKYILAFIIIVLAVGAGIRILINKNTKKDAEKSAEITKGAIKGAPKGMVLVGFPTATARSSDAYNSDIVGSPVVSDTIMVTKPKSQIDHKASVVVTKPKVTKKVTQMRKHHVSAVTPKHEKQAHRLVKTLKSRRMETSMVAYAFASLSKHKIFRLKPGGKPLLRTNSPKELASMIEKSLSVDPKGNTHLNERRCKMYGECATAYSYFYGIRTVHPEVASRLRSIIDLPKYLRSLKKTHAPKGKWVMSRVIVSYDAYGNITRRYDARGFARAFKRGEYAWCDLVSHKPILAGSCGNVVGKQYFAPKLIAKALAPAKVRNVVLQPTPKNGRWERAWAYASELENPAPLHPAEKGYAEIRFYAYSGDTALIVPIFGAGLSERDFGIKRPGDVHFERWSNAVCEENAPVICGFDALEGFTGKKVNRHLTGSFYLNKPGEYVLRVPRVFAEPATPDRVVLQLFHGSVAWPVLPARVVNPEVTARYEREVRAYKHNHSDGLLVLPGSYKHRIARVYYDLVEGAEHGSNLYFPRGQIKSAQQE